MGMQSMSAASDLHGNSQDRTAVKLFKRFVDAEKPKRRFFLGDLWNFPALRIKADEDEKRLSLMADFKAGLAFLEWYRPNVLTLGNHDQRLWDLIQKDGIRRTGPMTDLAETLVGEFDTLAAKLNILVLPYSKRKGVYRESGLAMAHGFDGLEPNNMANVYGDVIYGHGHAIERGTTPKLTNPKVARMIGCLCELDHTYNRAQTRTLRQQHGWVSGVFLDDRRHALFQSEVKNGVAAYADSIKIISA